jgi:hypothetical protein
MPSPLSPLSTGEAVAAIERTVRSVMVEVILPRALDEARLEVRRLAAEGNPDMVLLAEHIIRVQRNLPADVKAVIDTVIQR